MSAQPTLYTFDSSDQEARFWAQQLHKKPRAGVALAVRELDKAATLMFLLRAWEEEQGVANYWIGSLWDIPLVRAQLKELRQFPQSEVLQKINRLRINSPLPHYKERDCEALRCFKELLAPDDEVLSLEAWRELTEICRTTIIEAGTPPWSLQVISEQSAVSESFKEIWVPRVTKASRLVGSWPSCLEGHPNVYATASLRDDRGGTLVPDYALAKELGWKIQEPGAVDVQAVGKEFHVDREFRLKDRERRKRWQTKLDQHVFSPSELESYAVSPYGYFCERVLNLESPEETAWDLDPASIGILVHRVLELFYRKHQKTIIESKQKAFDKKALFAELDSILEQQISVLRDERPELFNLLVARQLQRIRRALHSVVQKDLEDIKSQASPLYPQYFEWSFGRGETGPLELKGAGGKTIRLRGTVDRIDVDPVKKTFLVIDYKSGSRKITGKDIERGASLQLPLYIEAVRQKLLPDYTPIGAVFFSLADMSKKDGMLRLDYAADYFELSLRSSSLMAPEKWQQLIDDSLLQASDIVTSLYAAEFPLTDGICSSYCPYQDMCRCDEVN